MFSSVLFWPRRLSTLAFKVLFLYFLRLWSSCSFMATGVGGPENDFAAEDQILLTIDAWLSKPSVWWQPLYCNLYIVGEWCLRTGNFLGVFFFQRETLPFLSRPSEGKVSVKLLGQVVGRTLNHTDIETGSVSVSHRLQMPMLSGIRFPCGVWTYVPTYG